MYASLSSAGTPSEKGGRCSGMFYYTPGRRIRRILVFYIFLYAQRMKMSLCRRNSVSRTVLSPYMDPIVSTTDISLIRRAGPATAAIADSTITARITPKASTGTFHGSPPPAGHKQIIDLPVQQESRRASCRHTSGHIAESLCRHHMHKLRAGHADRPHGAILPDPCGYAHGSWKYC